jgi:N12 class adenine-specific DNA methylase
VGNFIRRLPSVFSEAEITGVEIDGITARISKHLNPEAEIIQSGFEHTDFEDNSFDLAIGNVPFGDYNLNDPDYAKDWLIHDAFFRKALDKIAPGGVVAFITSSNTLDKKSPKVRVYLAGKAELIGAVRLPNNAFKDAGTKTTADIVFLQKRETPLLPYEEKPDWCYTVKNADGLEINSYFVENPQMILGKMEKTSFYNTLTCAPFEDAEFGKQLDEAIKSLNAKITLTKRAKEVEKQRGSLEAWGKNFAFTKDDNGNIFYRQGEKMLPVHENREQLSYLITLRDETRRIIEAQKRDIPDELFENPRKALNGFYDEYRLKFGVLNSDKVMKIFKDDSDCALLFGLESHNEKTGEWEKAAIFFKRTVNAVKEITAAASVEEALQISLDRKGKPDIAYISTLTDMSPAAVYDKLAEKNLIFTDLEKELPDSPYSGVVEKAEYLSGNVRKKLERAQTALNINSYYERNIKALKQVIPEDIKAEEITVGMRVPWIDVEDYTAFLQHLSGQKNSYYFNHEVHLNPANGDFEIENAGSRNNLNVNETTTYGTADLSLYKLAEKILNQKRIAVMMEVPDPKDPTKVITKTDPVKTKLALDKANKIKEEFSKWIFSDEERKEKYVRRYNDIFNSLVGREYDGSFLTFAGLNSEFTLRDYQKNAIARVSMGGNSLIAHVVGAGKSAVIAASITRKKELGLINKACVVVPKPLIEQTAKEWRKLYPDAKLLTVSNDDLNSENRRKIFTARVATGDYDAVIMSREQFEKIPMSRQYRTEFMSKELNELEDMLRERKRDGKGRKDFTVKQLEKAKKRLKAKIEKLTDPKGAAKAKDYDFIEFEELGFDFLSVDEAHGYKNGFVTTNMTNVSGVTTQPSGRAEDMLMKTGFFNEKMGNGHILMATGTPVSNSMTELYVMTRYLRPDLLEQMGVSRFDAWAATFGNVTIQYERTAEGTARLKTRFANFANIPELMMMYKEFADIKSAKKLDLPRPALKNNKNTIMVSDASPEQLRYFKSLAERSLAIQKGEVKPNEDNYLVITGNHQFYKT